VGATDTWRVVKINYTQNTVRFKWPLRRELELEHVEGFARSKFGVVSNAVRLERRTLVSL